MGGYGEPHRLTSNDMTAPSHQQQSAPAINCRVIKKLMVGGGPLQPFCSDSKRNRNFGIA